MMNPIPLTESIPPQGKEVLFYIPEFGWQVNYWFETRGADYELYLVKCEEGAQKPPTHWYPLPAAPVI